MTEQKDSTWFVAIRAFMDMVRKSKTLTWQQKDTLCGQAKSGDLEGARKGYEKIMKGEGYIERRKRTLL